MKSKADHIDETKNAMKSKADDHIDEKKNANEFFEKFEERGADSPKEGKC